MYAIIRDRGMQYRVEQGQVLSIDLLDEAEPGSQIELGEVLLVGGDGKIAAVHTGTGRELWSLDLARGLSKKTTSGRPPVLLRGLLVVPTSGPLVFVDPLKGRAKVAWNPGKGVTASPTVYGGRMYVLSNLGTVFALHHNLWHSGRSNASANGQERVMFKVRLQPRAAQFRTWDLRDLDSPEIGPILSRTEPWHGVDGRMETLNRLALWRALSGSLPNGEIPHYGRYLDRHIEERAASAKPEDGIMSSEGA